MNDRASTMNQEFNTPRDKYHYDVRATINVDGRNILHCMMCTPDTTIAEIIWRMPAPDNWTEITIAPFKRQGLELGAIMIDEANFDES